MVLTLEAASQPVNGRLLVCLVVIVAVVLAVNMRSRQFGQRLASTQIMLFGPRAGTTPLEAVDIRCGLILDGETLLGVPSGRGVCRVEEDQLSFIWAQKVYASIERTDAEVVVEPEGTRKRSIVVSDADTRASIRPDDWDAAFVVLREARWL